MVLVGAVTVGTVAAARLLEVPWGLAVLLALACAVAVPLAIALALGLVVGRFGLTLLRGLHANGYGLCSGATEDRQHKVPGLTDWLTEYFDTLAGRDPSERPLTFGDLWGAPPVEGARAKDTPVADRLVNLEVVTTAVSQQMCYSIPFRESLGDFYYDPVEWKGLFPERVMKWLDDASKLQSKGQASFQTAAGAELRKLPSNNCLPVVVAVRMSLSFPVLLSAVPLFARDFSDQKILRGMKRVWFSDGGISSNLPLHFFDAPLPGRPTFAVNLKAEHPAHQIVRANPACVPGNGRVYLPTTNSAGLIRYWSSPRDEAPSGLVRFFWDIIYTMQNWRDEIQFPQPGYRDRIVQISQLPDEGGLNLKMPQGLIDALGEAGECAAEKLANRFHPSSRAPEKGGWENHEEIRVRTFLHAVGEMITHPRVADPHWDAVVERCRIKGHYNQAEADLARELLKTLRELGRRIEERRPVSLETDAPKPQPTMRIAPRI